MTTISNINSSNINGAYPIAGQDNDSQGFRDNFTNIKTNFSSAKAEIEDLQNKVVLKSTLTGGDAIDNALLGVTLKNAQTVGFTESYYDHGNKLVPVVIDYSLGDFQKITVDGPITLSFLTWPLTGLHAKMRLWLTSVAMTTDTITFTPPPGGFVGFNKVVGYSAGVLTPPAAGDYLFEFSTVDGGATILVVPLIQP